MTKLLRLLAASALTGGLLVAATSGATSSATTAHAGPVTLTSSSTGAHPGAYTCTYVGRYAVDVSTAQYDAQDIDWTADITITHPDGTSTSDFVWSDGSAQTIQMCGTDRWRGTYTVEAVVTVTGMRYSCDYYGGDSYCDYNDYGTVDTQYLTTRFGVAVPQHHASLSAHKSRSGKHGWRLAATAKYDGTAWKGATTRLQVKRNGAWATVKQRRTDSHGVVGYAVVPAAHRLVAYRIQRVAARGLGAQTTKVFNLRRR